MTKKSVKHTLELMEIPDQEHSSNIKHPQKATKKRLSPRSKKLMTAGIILVVLFVLIVFVQKPQVILQFAATQAQGGTCSPAPFYCIAMGPNGVQRCTVPVPCPSPTPQPSFVAQQAPPPPNVAAPPIASAPATPATKSGTTTTCTNTPAALTTKLIIHFDIDAGADNGYTIMQAEEAALNAYAADLVKYPTATVTINGYTDNVPFIPGTPPPINTNQALSLARAKAAEAYLKSKGATKNTYVVKGNGATDFVAPNNGANGNVLNRRDEITTSLPTKECTTKTVTLTQPTCTNNVNWSGYLNPLTAGTQKAEVASTWTVATTTCSGKEIGISQWPGIDAGNKDIAQAGSMDFCNAGKITYYAWVVKPPVLTALQLPTQYTIKPGDSMTGTINMTALGKFTATLADTTAKWTYSAPMTFTAADDKLQLRQEVILEDEGYGVNPPVPGLTQFTTPTFSNNESAIGGAALTDFDQASKLTCLNLNATNATQQEDTGNIIDNNSFTAKWLHQ